MVGTSTVAGPAERVTSAAITELAPVVCEIAATFSGRLGYVAEGTAM
jgi:hypothetical protein